MNMLVAHKSIYSMNRREILDFRLMQLRVRLAWRKKGIAWNRITLNPTYERNTMKRALSKMLSKTVVGMKVEALATYLKVQFIHVPEHYKCEKIKNGRIASNG